ncbi:LexA family protein [Acinetobacter radioresistens]|uniref:LexA family protein n=1 Tax=Acinetobacter radioresistens TaxID=40216 RepID=UPI0035567D6A
MMSLHTRIQQKLNEMGLKPADLARATGKSPVAVGKWIHGDSVPKAETLKTIAAFLKVTDDWLLTGKDNGVVNFPTQKKEELKEEYGNVKPSKRILRKIPVLDFVQAGLWREVAYDGMHPKDETYTTYEGIDPKAVFSLEVDGMSMAPDYLPGDEIVVDAARSPMPGSLVIAQEIQHGVALTTFKKYRVIGVNEHGVDIIELVPLNPDFPTYNSMQIEISIIGVVVQHHRDLKY